MRQSLTAEQRWPNAVEIIGSTALEAMLLEAVCAPAPGLVDRFNAGAHQDMDIFTFMQSSSALAPAMYRFSLAAWNYNGPAAGLLARLRRIGAEAETAMFTASSGVNTQKGLLFLMGILTAAAALAARATVVTPAAITDRAAAVCSQLVERELTVLHRQLPPRALTAGETLYLAYGYTGIRGELASGLPSAVHTGVPALTEAIAAGLTLNDALIQTLLALMTVTEDTTLVNRHGPAALQTVRLEAGTVLAAGGMYTEQGRAQVFRLDQLYIKRGISPGGSADLLAASYFLYAMEKRICANGSGNVKKTCFDEQGKR